MSATGLLLRLDATHETGMGHAVRVRHLIDHLKTPLRLALAGRGETLRDLFPEATLRHQVTPEALAEAATAVRAKAWLNDTPVFHADEWRHMDLPGIILDDFGGDYPADLVINGTVLPQYHRYPMLATGGQVLCGGEYALLHPAFGELAWRAPAAPRVVMVIGGGERALAWARRLFSGEIDFAAWGEVSALFGRAFPAFPEIAARAAELGVTARQGLPSQELANVLAGASVALITGGMALYECMALGVPSVVFPQLRNLEAEAAWFAAHDCALDLGYDGGMDLSRVTTQVTALLTDHAMAARLSRNARGVIDGQGLGRAAAAIDTFLARLG